MIFSRVCFKNKGLFLLTLFLFFGIWSVKPVRTLAQVEDRVNTKRLPVFIREFEAAASFLWQLTVDKALPLCPVGKSGSDYP